MRIAAVAAVSMPHVRVVCNVNRGSFAGWRWRGQLASPKARSLHLNRWRSGLLGRQRVERDAWSGQPQEPRSDSHDVEVLDSIELDGPKAGW